MYGNCLFCFLLHWNVIRAVSFFLSICNGSDNFPLCLLTHSLHLSHWPNTLYNIAYNTSLSMHVMASTINLIETFSFYVGQMSGFQSVHSLNISIWSTLLGFSLCPSLVCTSRHLLFWCIYIPHFHTAIQSVLCICRSHHADGIELDFWQMPFDYMLNVLNASYYHGLKWLIQWNLIS